MHTKALHLVLPAVVVGLNSIPVMATDVDGVLPGALDQPQVNVQLRRPADPSTIVNFDPTDESQYIFSAFLDTGASSHLLSNVTAGTDPINNPGMGIQREQSGGTNVVFHDVGGGGQVDFNVSESLIYQIAPRTLDSTFSVPGDPTFVPQQGDFGPNAGPQRFQVGPSNQPIPDDPIAILLDPLADVNVMGMPAMTGKVVVMDGRGVNTYSTDPFNIDRVNVLNTFVYTRGTPESVFNPVDAADPQTSHNPGIPATNRHIKLSYADFSSFVSTTPSGAPTPNIAHNPFIGKDPVRAGRNIAQPDVPDVKVAYNGLSTHGSFLLDTGAGASFISTQLAQTLGIGYQAGHGPGDPALGADPILSGVPVNEQFKLSLAAFGTDDPNDPNDSSSITVAGFYLDSLLVRTEEGDATNDADANHINYRGAPVLVFDINVTDPQTGLTYPLDGVFGMNFLTASIIPPVTEDDLLNLVTSPGAFDWIVFDEPGGELGLSIVPEPATLGLLATAAYVFVCVRKRRQTSS
jgi:hypothetical protein